MHSIWDVNKMKGSIHIRTHTTAYDEKKEAKRYNDRRTVRKSGDKSFRLRVNRRDLRIKWVEARVRKEALLPI